MSRIVRSLCAAPSFASFGTLSYVGGTSGKIITMSSLQLWGFGHLVGETVSACIGGLDCGDYTVAVDGSISVPLQSDPDDLLTEAFLLALDDDWGEIGADVTLTSAAVVTVPVAVGKAYTTTGTILRPATQDEIKSPTGPALGKRRRAYQIAALLHNTVGVKMGIGTSNLLTVPRPGADGTTDLAGNAMFSGVSWSSTIDSYTFDCEPSWQMARPYPVTVCSVTAFIETSDK